MSWGQKSNKKIKSELQKNPVTQFRDHSVVAEGNVVGGCAAGGQNISLVDGDLARFAAILFQLVVIVVAAAVSHLCVCVCVCVF